MIKSIAEYLVLLRDELRGSDAATVQDALADAEEHLRAALANLREKQPATPEEDVLSQAIEQYGSPRETASAYREVERLTHSGLVDEQSLEPRSMAIRFFAIFADPCAWGALLYMLIAFLTGIIYFIWAVTGLLIIHFLGHLCLWGAIYLFLPAFRPQPGPVGGAARRSIAWRTHATQIQVFVSKCEVDRTFQTLADGPV